MYIYIYTVKKMYTNTQQLHWLVLNQHLVAILSWSYEPRTQMPQNFEGFDPQKGKDNPPKKKRSIGCLESLEHKLGLIYLVGGFNPFEKY